MGYLAFWLSKYLLGQGWAASPARAIVLPSLACFNGTCPPGLKQMQTKMHFSRIAGLPNGGCRRGSGSRV